MQFALITLFSIGYITSVTAQSDIEIDNVNPVDRNQSALSTTTAECKQVSSAEKFFTISCTGYNQIPTNILHKNETEVLNLDNGKNYINKVTAGALLRAKLPKLEILNIFKCQIRIIERGAFKGGENLLELKLSFNLIEVLDPIVFSELPNLRKLWVNNNPIKQIEPESVFLNPKLTLLDLGYCEIDFIDKSLFKDLSDLEELFLDKNNLTSLGWRALHNLKNLKKLKLYGNPWKCDCHVKFLQDFLIERRINYRYLRGPKCTFLSNNNASFDTFSSNNTDEINMQTVVEKYWHEVQNETLICSPTIKTLRKHYYSDAGRRKENFHLECKYSAYPEPEVKWLKNDEIISDLESFSGNSTYNSELTEKIEGKENLNKKQPPNINFMKYLVIPLAKADDDNSALNYTCFVSNVGGNTSKSLEFFIEIDVLTLEDNFIGNWNERSESDSSSSVWGWALIILVTCCIIILLLLMITFPLLHFTEAKNQGKCKNLWKEHDNKTDVDDGAMGETYRPLQYN